MFGIKGPQIDWIGGSPNPSTTRCFTLLKTWLLGIMAEFYHMLSLAQAPLPTKRVDCLAMFLKKPKTHLVPLVDKAGRFYKPLQDKGRGPNEINFYQKFWADQDIPSRVQNFFPRFYGTNFLEASDGSGPHEHAIIEDLTHHFHRPSVIDIKVGSRTWYPEASEQYIKKCLEKDRETTSLLLGFRVSGMQVYEDATKTNWKPDKKWCKLLNVERVKLALKHFASSNPSSDTDPDCALAPVIYGGQRGILAQLLQLKAWFEDQTLFHFYSSSLLFIYEGDPTAIDYGISVKMIDFSHVVDGQNIIDHNFLGGLCSLIKVISQMVSS